jgi:hypothetical protein
MTKKTPTPATFTVDIEKAVAVEYVGMTETLAWIRFSNGMRLDLSREQLVAIVSGYEKSLGTEKVLAQLSETFTPEFWKEATA